MSSFFRVRHSHAEGIESIGLKSWDDLEVLLGLDGTPRGSRWSPIEVCWIRQDGDGRADFAWLLSRPLVMRESAVRALQDLLNANGEILPLKVDKEDDLYVFSARSIDALDEDRCDLIRFDSGRVMDIRYAAFFEERLGGVDIFRVTQDASDTYVSQRFVDLYNEAALVGLVFDPVWSGAGAAPPPAPRPLIRPEPVARAIDADRPLDADAAEEVGSYVAEGLKIVGHDTLQDSPSVMAHLRAAIDRLRADPTAGEDDETLAALSCLWGQVVVDELGWEWAVLSLDGEEAYGVVSRDRSLAILVLALMDDWLTGLERENTSLLLFNMLAANDVPAAKAGDYRLLW